MKCYHQWVAVWNLSGCAPTWYRCTECGEMKPA